MFTVHNKHCGWRKRWRKKTGIELRENGTMIEEKNDTRKESSQVITEGDSE